MKRPEKDLVVAELTDIDLAVKELERCAAMGLKGAMIWNSAPDDQPYSSPHYDPVWSAAQNLQMPLSFHSLTGNPAAWRRTLLRDCCR